MSETLSVIGAHNSSLQAFLDNPGEIVNVFVDAVNGDDRNGGRSADHALQTIEQVYRRFPTQVYQGAQIIVNLAGVGGFGTDATAEQVYTLDTLLLGADAPFSNQFLYRGPEMVTAAPILATGSAVPTLDAVTPTQQCDQDGTPSATGQSTRLNFNPSPAWTVNDLGNKHVFILVRDVNGAKRFFEMPVAANGANFLVVNTPDMDGLIVNTDTVRIVYPGARLDGSVANFGTLVVVGNSSTSGAVNNDATFERLTLTSIQTTGTGLQFDRCRGSTIQGWIHKFASFVNCSAFFVGILIASSIKPTPRDDASDPVTSTGVQVALVVRGNANSGLTVGSSLSVFGFNGPRGAVLFAENVSVYGGTGILCTYSILGLGGSVAVQGSGNSGVGLKAQAGGIIQINGGDLATITGAGGDLQVDAGAAISYGTGVGQFEEAIGYNGNFTRVLEGTAVAPLGLPSYITKLVSIFG